MKERFKPSAKVICDSISPRHDRLITFEIEFHRFVLAEHNTHRTISRNFQSSRAVPVEKLIELVMTTPAIPVHFGKNQPGMVANEEHHAFIEWPWLVPDEEGKLVRLMLSPEQAWIKAAETSAEIARAFHNAGYHKQVVNRIIEPYLPVRGVITVTYEALKHFFWLRLHKDAQPEIRALAQVMHAALLQSEPTKLEFGEWHLPYVTISPMYNLEGVRVGSAYYTKGNWSKEDDRPEALSLEEAIKISISCCAQVSYRKLDDSKEKAILVYSKLNLPTDGVYPQDPPHFSPAEHVAKCCFTALEFSGNFACRSFLQYRKALEQGFEKDITKES